MSSIYGYSRYIYALARGGFLPSVLAITSSKHRAPQNALATGAVLVFAVALFISFQHASDAFLQAAAIFALIAWTLDMLTFIRLRWLMPHLGRPFQSPFGTPGAFFVVIMTSTMMMGLVWQSHEALIIFGSSIAIFAVIMGVFVVFIKRNMASSPDKEFVRQKLEQRRDRRDSIISSEDISISGFGIPIRPASGHKVYEATQMMMPATAPPMQLKSGGPSLSSHAG
ncbi:hypothetical protein HK105_208284 [Polyrhizophydium stewartii]|uniref:Amino acid permease/ SLC12A domain-containing protein n=1 Tax=Polyrhizophydium stewartii TaxID=2732419 RepID=A0ABR4MY77_9FUNG